MIRGIPSWPIRARRCGGLVDSSVGAIAISDGYGVRIHPITGAFTAHRGIDLPAPIGTAVLAPRIARVERVDVDGIGIGRANGNAVILRDQWGIRWLFLHLHRVAVGAGDVVTPAQVLGTVGQTGSATGPHLHLAVTGPQGAIDPVRAYPRGTFR